MKLPWTHRQRRVIPGFVFICCVSCGKSLDQVPIEFMAVYPQPRCGRCPLVVSPPRPERRGGGTAQGSRKNNAGDWADALFEAVGPERADVIRRALTRILHPDVMSGSEQLQRELNDAHSRYMMLTR